MQRDEQEDKGKMAQAKGAPRPVSPPGGLLPKDLGEEVRYHLLQKDRFGGEDKGSRF